MKKSLLLILLALLMLGANPLPSKAEGVVVAVGGRDDGYYRRHHWHRHHGHWYHHRRWHHGVWIYE